MAYGRMGVSACRRGIALNLRVRWSWNRWDLWDTWDLCDGSPLVPCVP
jgi:hypothetical protein